MKYFKINEMTSIKTIFLFGWMLLILTPATATVTRVGDTVTIEGKITTADADRFIELAFAKPVSRVVFHNSSGGQWSAGQRIGQWMVGRGITTVVEGFCASSCAMAFLGGDVRMFSLDKKEPVLIFHMPYLPAANESLATMETAWLSYIEGRIGKPIDKRFRDAIVRAKPPLGGVFLYAQDDPNIVKFGGLTLLCKGDEKNIPVDCEQSDEISAANLGVITQRKSHQTHVRQQNKFL